jgi:3-methylcrotonyl-CoA carboxylase alpha subunit
MGAVAVAATKAIGYEGAGTLEFLLDGEGNFYFMEMNTRLQVEHPVTEQITGVDLVEWQLRVAAGEALPRRQEQLSIRGHAIEARIYAENPDSGFLPSSGRLTHLAPPAASANVRVDTGVDRGDSIPPHYDPMIAKLIVWGEDRRDALARMGAALARYEIVGVAHNVEFLARLVRTPSFVEANLDTALIERERAHLFPAPAAPSDDVWLAGVAAELARREAATGAASGPWDSIDGWRFGKRAPHVVALRHQSDAREVLATFVRPGEYEVTLGAINAHARRLRFDVLADRGLRVACDEHSFRATAVREGSRLHVFVAGGRWDLEIVDPLYVDASDDVDVGGLRAPMPGKVVAHVALEGAKVDKGAPLLVLEAMKMELTICAPRAGVVQRFVYGVGEQVSEGTELVLLAENAS